MIALSLDNCTKADMPGDFNSASPIFFERGEGSRTRLNESATNVAGQVTRIKWSDNSHAFSGTNRGSEREIARGNRLEHGYHCLFRIDLSGLKPWSWQLHLVVSPRVA